MEEDVEFTCPRTEDSCLECARLICQEVYAELGRNTLGRFVAKQAQTRLDKYRFPVSQLDDEALFMTCQERRDCAVDEAQKLLRRNRPSGAS